MDLLSSEIVRVLAFLVGVIAFAALNAAYLVWLERKEAAHMQLRVGPKEVGPFGLLQPLADGAKLMTKQLFLPKGCDPILFMIAPLMIMVPAIMSFVTIPFSETLVARNINIGLLMIFAFASINVLGLLLGGWQCPFGVAPGVWWFLLKLYILVFTVIWIRWTYPRTTFYGLLNLSWKILIPVSLINLILTAGMLKVF
jgi:NADH:ubiquinone oxidoreductase subunit H